MTRLRHLWRALPLLLLLLAPVRAAPVDDDLESTVALMAKIGFSASPSFSPDGGQIAFVSNISGIPQVWTVPVESGWPAKVTALDDPVDMVRWSPAGDWLAFSLAPGGGMNQQIYLVRPGGGDPRRITAGGETNYYLGDWGPTGRLLAFASNRRRPDAIDAYTYEPARGRTRLRARGDGFNLLTGISRDRKTGVLERIVSRGDNNLFLVNLASRQETLLTPHEPPAEFGGGFFSPDARTVYLSTNEDRDLLALGRIRLGDDSTPGDIEVIAARDDAGLEEFAVSGDGRTAALLWNVAGRSKLSFVDLATGQATPGPELPAAVASEPTFSADGRLLALIVSGAAAPRDVWLLDCDTGQFRQLTHSPHAGVDLTRLTRPRLVRFRSFDGVELSGWLYQSPETRGPGPVVLSFHGGPEGQARPVVPRRLTRRCMRRGIAVFAPNVRGSAGFGKKLRQPGQRRLRFDGVKDIEADG